MENIQPDSSMADIQDVENTPDVDSLIREMSRTSISQKSVSLMGPLRPNHKRALNQKSRFKKVRRLILLRIINDYPYATIIETSPNLEALDLNS